MFGKKKKTIAQPKRFEAKGNVINVAKSQETVKLERGDMPMHVEQVADCAPTLWLGSMAGLFSDSRLYTFKDLDQLEQFALQLHQQIIAVKVMRAVQEA